MHKPGGIQILDLRIMSRILVLSQDDVSSTKDVSHDHFHVYIWSIFENKKNQIHAKIQSVSKGLLGKRCLQGTYTK